MEAYLFDSELSREKNLTPNRRSSVIEHVCACNFFMDVCDLIKPNYLTHTSQLTLMNINKSYTARAFLIIFFLQVI